MTLFKLGVSLRTTSYQPTRCTCYILLKALHAAEFLEVNVHIDFANKVPSFIDTGTATFWQRACQGFFSVAWLIITGGVQRAAYSDGIW